MEMIEPLAAEVRGGEDAWDYIAKDKCGILCRHVNLLIVIDSLEHCHLVAGALYGAYWKSRV